MRPARHVISAGILAAALGFAPAVAAAQSSSASSPQGQDTATPQTGQSSTPQSGTTQPSTTTQQPSTTPSSSSSAGGAVDEQAARQHLQNAREALAELTKLPAASQLQGEQRTAVSNFISAFNTFATASTDWKSKYTTVDQQLDQLLGLNGSTPAGATPEGTGAAATGTESSTGTTAAGTSGSEATGGSLDPTIVEKLKKVRSELDAFEMVNGDPTPHIEAIQRLIEQTGAGAASGTVGTSGSASSAASGTSMSAGGSVTLTAEQVQEIRKHLDALRQIASH